jgi:hypothetical protein
MCCISEYVYSITGPEHNDMSCFDQFLILLPCKRSDLNWEAGTNERIQVQICVRKQATHFWHLNRYT